MDREDIYKYFILEAKLYSVLMSWLRNTVKDTEYAKMPYKIINFALLDGGCIGFNVKFLDGDLEFDESYRINVKELENVI